MLLSSIAEFLSPFARLPAVEAALEHLRRDRPATLAGLAPPAVALMVAHVAGELRRPVIVVVESDARAEELAAPLRFFLRAFANLPPSAVGSVPALDVAPGAGSSPHPEILETRGVSLWRYATEQTRVLLVPAAAARMRARDATFYSSLGLTLVRDEEVPLEDLVAHLISVGYVRAETVEMPGQFTVRGGILDVFPPEAGRPVRLELLGDTLESLREFDPETQRSVRPLERVSLPPLTDEPDGWHTAPGSSDENVGETPIGTLFDLRPETIVILEEAEAIAAAQDAAVAEVSAAEGSADAARAPWPFLSEKDLQRSLERCARLELTRLPIEKSQSRAARRAANTVVTQPATRYHGNLPAFLNEARSRLAKGERVLAAAGTPGELERLADLCREYELPFRLAETEPGATGDRLADDSAIGSVAALLLVRAPLDAGFIVPEARMALYGSGDLLDALPTRSKPRQRSKTATFFSDMGDWKPGDYVVHLDHGIGRFENLQQMESGGTRGEFLRLIYADDARLYVPVERMDLVQPYHTAGGAAPPLDALGGVGWTTRKARVKKSLEEMADKLLELYAERQAAPGHAFPPDSAWQREFEEAFEFEETPDQVTAITDVKRDMENTRPMDRLLCGDVGYGKTEVAMRAAFKAVMDGKQVVVLTPTTVLAFQHWETFRRRFAAFPVRIEMISRFRTPAEQKKVLLAAESGQVDILIGTHRLLSKDVKLQSVGLVIVDEEQRFGVGHKERLKVLRPDVDVLTLSATPIPRTLHMSLVGMRDLSLIETPPTGRLAIQTVVAPFSESVVKRAIEQELERDGQVFFIHNRVESIGSVATLVRKLVPKARIVVGHGQMNEKALEAVMLKFVRNEANVLISTTIVENGLDIPRANTIVVNRAERLGLSELYQLRGRVGRSNERAYAYLLVPPETTLSDIAKQRLAALREFSELGSGFRLAALDLELRGAGNLLGRQQHGHINAIGFDLYCQMLDRAVAQRKGETTRPERRATVNLGMDIRIPPEYIAEENLRLRTYKRIAELERPEARQALLQDLSDRFGPPPQAILNLLDYSALKGLAESLGVASIERRGSQVAVKFHEETPVPPERLVKVLRSTQGLRLDPAGVLWIEVERGVGRGADAIRNVLLRLEAES
ncbi:MAG: transcription-repair coupling factor [Candidatus Acidiferrales bacterium]|jgi:transcription-repair coupling factor (superfamily II helicase)